MKQKVITMLAELKPSGTLKIDTELLPKGYKLKRILSSTPNDNFNCKDPYKKCSYLVTLLLESGQETEVKDEFTMVLNPYF